MTDAYKKLSDQVAFACFLTWFLVLSPGYAGMVWASNCGPFFETWFYTAYFPFLLMTYVLFNIVMGIIHGLVWLLSWGIEPDFMASAPLPIPPFHAPATFLEGLEYMTRDRFNTVCVYNHIYYMLTHGEL